MRYGELLGLLSLIGMDWFLIAVLFNTSEPFGTFFHVGSLVCVAYAIGLSVWHFWKLIEWAGRN
jgi:hypothetical protein